MTAQTITITSNATITGPSTATGTPCILDATGSEAVAVFYGTEIWGDPAPCASLAEIEDVIREVCDQNADFTFPGDGLAEDRDFFIRYYNVAGSEIDPQTGEEIWGGRMNPLLPADDDEDEVRAEEARIFAEQAAEAEARADEEAMAERVARDLATAERLEQEGYDPQWVHENYTTFTADEIRFVPLRDRIRAMTVRLGHFASLYREANGPDDPAVAIIEDEVGEVCEGLGSETMGEEEAWTRCAELLVIEDDTDVTPDGAYMAYVWNDPTAGRYCDRQTAGD